MKINDVRRVLMLCIITILCMFFFVSNVLSNEVIISEIMALNSKTLQDEDGNYSDWIELYNTTSENINLLNWSLTDDPGYIGKWRFPEVILPAGGYIVVFASGKNRTNVTQLHTNFKLSGTGEYLALFKPIGIISSSFGKGFPEQIKDISYGQYEGNFMFFDIATPGEANISHEYLTPPDFDPPRGFYNETINVILSNSVVGSKIYYTIDGSAPDNTDSEYTFPVEITTTTPLRAIVYKDSSLPSASVTHTYFFLDDVLNQPNNPAGYPSEWGDYVDITGKAIADYEIDPDITNHADYQDLMIPSFKSVPTISIVTDIGYVFSHAFHPDSGGIYIYVGAPGDERGLGWERPVSCEYIFPDGEEQGFSINCGLRIQGGHSRRPEKSPKHSLRLLFKSEYGPGKLDYPVFGENAADKFNTLVLRAGYGNTWRHADFNQRNRAQHIRDPWSKDTQLEMGHVSTHNKFAHLYINGLYWGLYNISERIDEEFMDSYYTGGSDGFDVIKDYDEIVCGNSDAWEHLWDIVNGNIKNNVTYQSLIGNNSDGTPNLSYNSYLDPVNLIDYILINFYGGNNDWDEHNWATGRNRENPGKGFQFYCWDTEKILENKYENYVNENNERHPSGIFQRLINNEEFKMLFADRVNLHLKNNGVLTQQPIIDRWMVRANEIELAMISESARWGDYRRDVHPWWGPPYDVYNVYDYWLEEQDRLFTDYFQDRTEIVLGQLETAGMLPNIDAPEFSQYGGTVPENFKLAMTAPEGDIYYTMDETDPRQIGGAISVYARTYIESVRLGPDSVVVKARAYSGSEWSALTESTYYNEFFIPSGITASLSSTENINIYPNPFSSYTTVNYNLPVNGNVEISLLSMDGKQISKEDKGYQNSGEHSYTLIPEGLQNGLYMLKISCGYYNAYSKLVYIK